MKQFLQKVKVKVEDGEEEPRPVPKLTPKESKMLKLLRGGTGEFNTELVVTLGSPKDTQAACRGLIKTIQGLLRKTKKKKVRKPTAYNKYFKDQMEKPEIKRLPHKERMKAVAEGWKKLPPRTKQHLKAAHKRSQD